MDEAKFKELLRIFLAGGVAFCIFIIIIFLAQTHRRTTIEEALKNLKDEELRVCVEKHTKKNGIKFTYKVDSIECALQHDHANRPLHIKNIDGIELFKYIRRIELKNSQIGSLSPLKDLKELEYLNLENSNISTLDDIVGLTNLQELNLYGNNIKSAKGLESLRNLAALNLGKNQVSDLSFLVGLKNLQELNLRSNLIRDLNMPSLKQLRILNLSGNNVSDISSLRSCINLRELYLFNNHIKDVSPLKELYHLHVLDLGKNLIEDVNPLSDLHLGKLILQNNSVRLGVDQLFNNREVNRDYVATVDLDLNTKIPCEDLAKLKSKVAGFDSIEIIEPGSCDELAAVAAKRRTYFWRRSKKKGVLGSLKGFFN